MSQASIADPSGTAVLNPTKPVHACCFLNKPAYRITYTSGKTYMVCKSCFGLPHWSRYMESKEDLVQND